MTDFDDALVNRAISDRAAAIEERDALDVKRLARAMFAADHVAWPKRWDREEFDWIARQVAAGYAAPSPDAHEPEEPEDGPPGIVCAACGQDWPCAASGFAPSPDAPRPDERTCIHGVYTKMPCGACQAEAEGVFPARDRRTRPSPDAPNWNPEATGVCLCGGQCHHNGRTCSQSCREANERTGVAPSPDAPGLRCECGGPWPCPDVDAPNYRPEAYVKHGLAAQSEETP